MASSLVAKLQLDIAAYQAALARSDAELGKWKDRAKQKVNEVGAAHAKMTKNLSGGGANRGLANAAMQAQDIAVQMQMGTSAAIVLGQQGSQLLSAFGTGGALAGGVIAIGAAFFTMGQHARQAFNDAKSEAEKLDEELALIASGTQQEMAVGIGKIDEDIKHWTDELEDLNTLFGTGANIADIFGGPDVEERIRLISERLNKLGSQRAAMANNMLDLSKKELEIELARVNGEEEKADYIERELKWIKEWKRIDALPLPENMRDELKANAWNKEGAQAQQEQNKKDEAAAKKAESEAKKLEAAQQKLSDAKEKSAEEQMTLEERIAYIQQKIADVKPDKADDPLSQVEADLQKVELETELNRLSKEKADNDLRDKKHADDKLETLRKQIAAEQKILAQQKEQSDAGRNQALMTLEMLRLRARGNESKADKIERDARIRDRKAQLRGLGASPEAADSQAREEEDRRDQIERRQNGQPGHIYGRRGQGRKMGSPGGSGLKEYEMLQSTQRDKFERQYHDYHNPLEQRGQRPHRFGNEGGSLADRATRAAGAQDERGSRDSTAMDLGKQILATVKQGLGLN